MRASGEVTSSIGSGLIDDAEKSLSVDAERDACRDTFPPLLPSNPASRIVEHHA
ncbi:hypothetical protein HMPREF0762_01482 [Slackia exigua ATCC 700122]|uniref:Uncharacterized protein n=1 Tax=Slackia exigua (strain ATCC 700122 / DSM 15923 / CIP 105133 / JCM 11022 / KCTC 5966 / S-7) TaxID=649764 RepID=D0WI11_SLAES|nr:hypothetical protein HMPREF0762_01482 [Slackia exigua ATCC 700122]